MPRKFKSTCATQQWNRCWYNYGYCDRNYGGRERHFQRNMYHTISTDWSTSNPKRIKPWQTITFTKRRQQIRRPTQSNKEERPRLNYFMPKRQVPWFSSLQIQKKIISTWDVKNKGFITPRIQNQSYTPKNLDKIQHTSSISNTDTS